MKKLLLLTVIALVTCVGAMAQAPEIQWQKSFGGSNYDEASYVQLTTDGGYIVAVYSESDDGDVTGHHGGFDYWIVKLDASGAMEWQKSLGGTSNDFVRSIQQTTDGGYIVVGDSYSDDGDVTGHHGSSDYWIVKLGITTGIHDMQQDASALFSLFPNPNNGRFIIEGPASGRGSYNLSISNVLGQKVYSQTEQVNGDKLRVEMAAGELVPGIYFLNVSKEGKSVAVKQFVVNEK